MRRRPQLDKTPIGPIGEPTASGLSLAAAAEPCSTAPTKRTVADPVGEQRASRIDLRGLDQPAAT